MVNEEKCVDEWDKEGIEGSILFVVEILITAVAMTSLFSLAVGLLKGNSLLFGIGIMILGVTVYIIWQMIYTVPQMQEWVIELFGRYYRTWRPGLHFLIPHIMTIRGKVTVKSTKVIKLFMRGDSELDFLDDSAELTVEIRAMALDPKCPTYRVIFTDDEIKAIEEEETQKGNTLLPERWMYFTRIRVESAVRGICGRFGIDDAIKSVSYAMEEGKIKLEIDESIPESAKVITNEALKPYRIKIEEILITNIKLSEPTEKARREIQIEEKGIQKREKILEQKQVEAEFGTQEGIRKRNELEAIIASIRDDAGSEIPSGLTRADAMKWLVAMKATELIDKVTILSGGKDEAIPSEIAARFGASFGVGTEAIKSNGDRNKKQKENNE
jgi:regulator of protease activity HflC (stomatin/prohibitin superfamily)